MATKSIAVPDAIYERAQAAAAAEGTTLETFATKALERDFARRWLERIGRESERRAVVRCLMPTSRPSSSVPCRSPWRSREAGRR